MSHEKDCHCFGCRPPGWRSPAAIASENFHNRRMQRGLCDCGNPLGAKFSIAAGPHKMRKLTTCVGCYEKARDKHVERGKVYA